MTRIRTMSRSDVPQILELEKESFASPWSEAMILLELGGRDAVCLVDEREDGRGIAGYLFCSLLAGDWHLIKIAVDAELRRRGHGERLLEALLATIPPDARVTLEVRPSNLGAIRLYDRNGFLLAGRRPRYYADSGEDALIMWRTPATLRGSLADVPEADRTLA